MKNEIEQLGKARSLLSQALSVAVHNMGNNRSVSEARGHIKQAINKIDKASKTQLKRRKVTESQFSNWWEHIQSGVSAAAHSPVSEQAQEKSLDQLNAMIDHEKGKLEELDKESKKSPDQILKD